MKVTAAALSEAPPRPVTMAVAALGEPSYVNGPPLTATVGVALPMAKGRATDSAGL